MWLPRVHCHQIVMNPDMAFTRVQTRVQCSLFFFFFLPTSSSSSLATATPTFFRFCNLLYSFSVCNVSTAVFVCLVRFSEVTAIVSPSSISLTCGMVDFCSGECECLLSGRMWVFTVREEMSVYCNGECECLLSGGKWVFAVMENVSVYCQGGNECLL